MICKDCIKNDVCKHYIYLKKYDGLKLKDCSYGFNLGVTEYEKEYTESKIRLLKSTTKDDIIEQIQKANKSNEDLNQDFKLVSKPSELIKCSSCDSFNYPEDLVKCNKCGIEICPVCGFQTYDCNADKQINICENCWNKEE